MSNEGMNDDGHPGLVWSLQGSASRLSKSDGTEILFSRAVLAAHNPGSGETIQIVPHATLAQEGGTEQDVSGAFAAGAAVSIPMGGSMSWDVYDLLLPAHSGIASKVHMFGYRAVLNWRFDLAVWAEVRTVAGETIASTSASRWSLKWSVPDASTGAVALMIVEG